VRTEKTTKKTTATLANLTRDDRDVRRRTTYHRSSATFRMKLRSSSDEIHFRRVLRAFCEAVDWSLTMCYVLVLFWVSLITLQALRQLTRVTWFGLSARPHHG